MWKSLFILLISFTGAFAQWNPLDVPRGCSFSDYEFVNDNTAFAVDGDRLWKWEVGGRWTIVEDVSGISIDEMTTLNDNVVVLGRQDGETVALWSDNIGATWHRRELGDYSYKVIPRSTCVIQFSDCQSKVRRIEVVEVKTGTKQRRDYDCIMSDDIEATQPFEIDAITIRVGNGPNGEPLPIVTKYSNLTNTSDQWTTETLGPVPSLITMKNFGFGVRKRDTVFAIRGDSDRILVLDSKYCNEDGPREMIYSGDYWCYNWLNNIVWSSDGRNWNVSADTSGNDVLDARKRIAARMLNSGAARIDLIGDNRISNDTVGLVNALGDLISSGSNVVCKNSLLSQEMGFATWHDYTSPLIVDRENGNASINDRVEVLGNSVWLYGGLTTRFDLATKEIKIIEPPASGIADVAIINGREIGYDQGFHEYQPQSNTWRSLPQLDTISPGFEMFGFNSELLIFRVTASDLGVITIWVSGYTLDGTQTFGPAKVTDRVTSTSGVWNFRVNNYGDQLALYDYFGNKVYNSSDSGRTWKFLFCPLINTNTSRPHIASNGVWFWDEDGNAAWCTTNGGATWDSLGFPSLPNRVVKSAFCLYRNCYLDTDAGVYTIPKSLVSVHEEQSEPGIECASIRLSDNGTVRASTDGLLSIYTMDGQLLSTQRVQAASPIPVSLPSSGAYLLCLVSDNCTVSKLFLHVE